MTRIALAALAVTGLLAAYLWAVNEIHTDMQGWDEYGDVDCEPIAPIHSGRGWCNHAGCKWETTNPSSWGRMNDYLDHRDADHE